MHFKYLSYVIRHKWFVFIESCKLGIPWRGLLHDISKLLPSEWFPYAMYFYGDYPEWNTAKHEPGYPYCASKEGVAESFDYAWLLHQKRNKHHWQWWMLPEDNGGLKVLPMPLPYRKEMLADWKGARRALGHGNDVKEWYIANKDKMVLHPETRAWVEKQILV